MKTVGDSDFVDDYQGPQATGLNVPWPGLSVVLGIITLTALGTLAVITSVKDVDTLSTVALALAVLSFAAQLIVTMAQGQQSAQLSAETKTALAEMRATTSSLLTNQREQFDRVLSFAFANAIPAAVQDVAQHADDTESPSADEVDRIGELEKALQVRFEEVLGTLRQGASTSTQANVRNYLRDTPTSTLVADWARKLDGFPEREKAEAAAAVIRTLPPRALVQLDRLGVLLGRSPSRASTMTRSRNEPIPEVFEDLVKHGLVTRSTKKLGEREHDSYKLTPFGIEALQVLRSRREDRPDWAADLL